MSPATTVLRGAGTAVVLAQSGDGLPSVLHWGPDLPDAAVADLALVTSSAVPHNALDAPWPLTVLPTSGEGWLGTPGYAAHRAGGRTAPRWVATVQGGDGGVEVRATASGAGVELVVRYRLDEHGVLVVESALTNTSDDPTALDVGALRAVLPLPARAAEVLDLTGRWCRERSPQRHPLADGTWLRTGRRGRTGHDATLLMVVGTAGFGFRSGEVWAAHVAWSGNHEHLVERLSEGAGPHAAVLGGGEALALGEVRLAPGETYAAPPVVFVHSTDGLDGLTRSLVRHQRAQPGYRSTPRPLVLNTWEAVYFDTDLDRLKRLADTGASIGVERFVLDDGWFGGRRDDRRGLGDWQVSADVWPHGLGPLVDHVKGLGMEFGLWFEPEMVNPDSDLARAHPDWVLQSEHGPGLPSRQQHVLDVGHPEAYAYVVERISSLVKEYAVSYLKWDHNRPLVDAGQAASGRPGVHAQTEATYRMLEELKRLHPGLEIESCCAGGGRLDLGIMEHADRAWVSDCIDAHERHRMVRWTGLTLPPELMGTHVGSDRDHTTGRRLSLDFRAGTALFGHFGIEWDLTNAGPDELDRLRTWIERYKEHRSLLHSGAVVNADVGTAGLELTGVVARDRGEALYRVSALEHSLISPPGRVPLPGLDPDRVYLVTATATPTVPIQGFGAHSELTGMPWARDGVRMTGRLLEQVGVQAPPLPVDELVLIRATAL
ncbi:MAG: alpha-galactosidase [Ornithinibacter sp.]